MPVSDSYLAAYLTDHLAGSVVALDLLAQLQKSYHDRQIVDGAAKLRAEIEPDRRELQILIEKLGIKESAVRKTTGWLAAKLAELKLRWEDDSEGPLRLLESIEAVALGIDGKLALWRALETVAEIAAEIRKVDYGRLIARAQEQREVAESMRLMAARLALVPETESPRPAASSH
jgi:hypothetical protein